MANKEALAYELVQLLSVNESQIATAESCTGGGIGQAITAIAGSSAVYGYGIISYSNEAKMNVLQVPVDILAEFGAVSRETAYAMLKGALQLSDADYAIAVTGIAGPGGGSADKPVGLVYIGAAAKGGRINISKNIFDGDRIAVREQTICVALQQAIDLIKESANEA